MDKTITQRFFLALERHEPGTVDRQIYPVDDVINIFADGGIGVEVFLFASIGKMAWGTSFCHDRGDIGDIGYSWLGHFLITHRFFRGAAKG